MGKNIGNSWLSAVKKAFKSPSNDNEKRSNKRREQNEQEEEEKKRGKRRWIFGKHFPIETTIQHKVAKTAINLCANTNMVAKQPEMDNHSLSEQKRAIAIAEAAVVNAVEIIRLTKTSLLVKQHDAALVIQTFFRGYLARRALLALKGVVKMQALIRGHNVRKRAMVTLQCIQSLVRVQALVCDQRRRLSCDATMSKISAGNITSDNLDLEEIQALIQKAKQCSLKPGKTLAHILSHQTWTLDEDQKSDNYQDLEKHERMKCPDRIKTIQDPTGRKDRNLCNPIIKTVEIDTSRPYSFTPPPKKSFVRSQNQDSCFIPSSVYNSPKTPSYQTAETPTSRSIYLYRMSLSENSCPLPKPSYMGPTQSAIARVRSHSTPRQRPSSPSRQQTSSARKRLSFPVHDGHYCSN
ncbi:protein iq-domain 14 [Phtheirospermum japonicum]|uniref:Protein iq-domain 14 n=1 Tax=Phtheirospermum japonicum TaxID=374723 RepID=A0A830C3B6_9LAMI|nr:protein iq-domain 14 [Phtheirospermum japonicum]